MGTGMLPRLRSACVLATVLVLDGCVYALGSHALTGTARPKTDADQVVLYSSPPLHSEVIGQVYSRSTLEGSDQDKIEAAVSRLRKEAAEMGANGIVLQFSPGAPPSGKPGSLVSDAKIPAFVTQNDHDVLLTGEAIYTPAPADKPRH